MVNLRQKPYHLTDNQIHFLKNTLENMTTAEKVGQLFFVIGQDEPQVNLADFIKTYKPGGMMYRPGPADKLRKQIEKIQSVSKYPLFLAANLESGGNGIIAEGTWVGNPLQIAATDDPNAAYQLGRISAYEANQVGCNMSFAPIVDIDLNFRNPITNTRTYGSDKDRVLAMSQAQIKGFEENHIIPVIKHFPGDGVDERDQHLLSSINSLSANEWMESFGHIYKTLIDQGIPSVMIGHIFQPAWERKLQPSIAEKDLRPASASPLLINGLLRQTLGFEGLAITDATAMIGYNVILPRAELLVETINAGIDMILFNKNIDEDYAAVTTAVENGQITAERLDEAVTRILATKLAQGLVNETGAYSYPLPEQVTLKPEEHLALTAEIADQAVTLVKDRDQLLPLTPEKYPRIRLVVLGDTDSGGFKEGGKVTALFKEGLEAQGFEVSLYGEKGLDFHEIFEEGIAEHKEKFDLALYVANVETASNQTTTRINWIQLMAANAPWFMQDIPTVFVSTANPYHLFDVPYISTFVNSYTGNPSTVKATLDKLTGQSEFKGISPVDPFCGDFSAKL
ncbi:glycoside hydrolase family 3 protein [Streptococcus merionis]|uniref:beta-N-acetylhexosaminidase n=1 Tax=Streptococcus merionis TaxID=400065 RepID=A0A239T2B9_9STRE|nr:glycoside hydrolase family 3 N-terminal domain-containing protein [Streptococcus merionis]SNU91094.1 beta-hexosamidase a, glycoside hydrolase family 3 [Streptococcus merionis]